MTKASIEIQLSCGHSYKVEERPNPRKKWPDAQRCEICKKKFRPVYIHTQSEKKVRRKRAGW